MAQWHSVSPYNAINHLLLHLLWASMWACHEGFASFFSPAKTLWHVPTLLLYHICLPCFHLSEVCGLTLLFWNVNKTACDFKDTNFLIDCQVQCKFWSEPGFMFYNQGLDFFQTMFYWSVMWFCFLFDMLPGNLSSLLICHNPIIAFLSTQDVILQQR